MVALAGCAVTDAGDDQTPAQASAQLKGDAAATPGGTIPVTLKPGVHDPGPRGGAPAAGKPIRGLDKNQLAMFNEGRFRVREFEATCDGCANITIGTEIPPGGQNNGDANSAGAGARFNSVSCGIGCHSQPDIGGTSDPVNQSFFSAHYRGATNKVPFFETIDGPTREVRFTFNPDGTRDGGVHQKFTVKGRTDAPDCVDIEQPDFEGNRDNMSFRIPSALFGLGLIDALQDKEILANHDATAFERSKLGIRGVTNNSPNDGTISRFGWKAQNKSVTQFAGEAYNVELGITNDLDPTSKTEDDRCNLASEPADLIHTNTGTPTDPTDDFNEPTHVIPVWMSFMMFMRFLDQPKPAPLTLSAQRGRELFQEIGCADCHTPHMHTKAGELGTFYPQLRDVEVNLFSDILLHNMGARLADNVIQGNAGPDMFRTAPLWGIGQRLFFLHDGRSKTLDDAILQHYSDAAPANGRNPAYGPSEANQVVRNYGDLDAQGQQDVLNFLRRL
ncbi:MAG TPA: di-heme oxidoredictase family protein [Kofleriaceae bacterium]|nr:di-heme oxidoredictase family protein [Kofleriaceae bacterium]